MLSAHDVSSTGTNMCRFFQDTKVKARNNKDVCLQCYVGVKNAFSPGNHLKRKSIHLTKY